MKLSDAQVKAMAEKHLDIYETWLARTQFKQNNPGQFHSIEMPPISQIEANEAKDISDTLNDYLSSKEYISKLERKVAIYEDVISKIRLACSFPEDEIQKSICIAIDKALQEIAEVK